MKKLLMKKMLSKKKRRINSKKGLSLLELIVAIIILLVVISATVSGLNLSYRSVLIGAEKDDAQSLAQRNCDIIMAAISRNAEDGTLSTKIVGSGTATSFESGFFATLQSDIELNLYWTDSLGVQTGYDPTLYADIEQYPSGGSPTAAPNKKKQYVKIEQEERDLTSADGTTTKTYDAYKITTYVYYGYEDNMYITCEGEVNVERP
ncbi:MAG: prepilin-type N-terminal cleavage/methylation domain-containing protein [Acutalibacteraceae bacterium]|nr:prepilin-type N-terminal cleavage/methylation domain-containing protein [Acutalibacteraceae bacterium]